MPGQSPINQLLSFPSEAASVRPDASQTRRRESSPNDGFQQVFNGTRERSLKARQDAQAQRAESRRGSESSTARSDVRETERARPEPRSPSASERSRESDAATPRNIDRAEPSRRASDKAEEVAPGNDDKALAQNEAAALLAELEEGQWSSLSEDVTALLGELKAQVDEGSLSPELENALRDLLAQLEQGAPLDQLEQTLAAIPLSGLPELAARFPGASNLREALGRTGAAYLSQLRAVAGQAPATGSGSESRLSIDGEIEKVGLDLKALLQASTLANKTSKAAFDQTLQALAESSARTGASTNSSFDGAQSPANALAQLDSASRGQPLSPTERGFTVQTDVRVPVNQGQWGQAVGQKVLWMASQKLSSAELRLDPPDLGPMQVRVSTHQDQVSVTFTSPQAAVREALDQNANRLREMFAEQGLDLVDVNVSDQSGQEQASDDAEGRSGGRGAGSDHEDAETQVIAQRVSDRLVDHYA